ncbi:enhancer of mRNA-decapping protein 4 isoform X2 [Physcomitrium patens]|uniref:enhancer of mRNA-decapping protein 4 isoform X2 n=1 Tax=Physcomitrium patens TaxID=3218 RepID=UPI000D17DC36|nr:enhancer of mRNA-decapping protein 4-like isoform X2 [Physcomitrium patens]|eukprot:XP_024388151.1 enhancer of mRNA-decapping protein 4-like isoform X2 [Physcomitrella patens]
MGAPGPPGVYDLQKYSRGPTQSPHSPQLGSYQPSSQVSSFHYQLPSRDSNPLGSNPPSSYQPSSYASSNLQCTNYTYFGTQNQQSGSPVCDSQKFMHNVQDQGPRTQAPYSTALFNQQPGSSFPRLPSSSLLSNQAQSSLPMSSSSLSSQSKFSQTGIPCSPASGHSVEATRLMALLTTQQSEGQGANEDDENSSVPGAHHRSPRLPVSPRYSNVSFGIQPSSPASPVSVALPIASLVTSAAPRRLASKPLKGQHLRGDHIIYDVDICKSGEAQPQLKVSPITVYGSDPSLVLGRQIAVNKKFICYGLRGGTIRVLNKNNAQKILLRGHTQRVSDIAFFSESVHLLASAGEDGNIFVRQIHEGLGENEKLAEYILFAIQLVGDWEACHPRLCWHPTTQDVFFVAIGKYVVKIDINEAKQSGGSEAFSTEHPLVCRLGDACKGISVTAQHDDVITDFAVPFSDPCRLTSASKDGTVRVWEEHKQCLSKFTPYNGNSVDAVSYLFAPQNGNLQFLLTGGPLNQSIRLWMLDEISSKTGQGVWKCTQTLEFKVSSTIKPEKAFFNQIVVAPRAGLILVANAKRHAIYAIHVGFSSTSGIPRMDYLTEFAVAIPILSLTVADDAAIESCEGNLKVFCVQTQAIQQYALDLSQCLPPPVDEQCSEGSTPSTTTKSFSVTQTQWTPTSTAFTALEKGHQKLTTTTGSTVIGITSMSSGSANPGIPLRPTTQHSVAAEGNRVTERTNLITAVPLKDHQDGAAKPTGILTFGGGLQPSTRSNIRPEVTREGYSSSNNAKPPARLLRRRSRSISPAKVTDKQCETKYTAFSNLKAEEGKMVKDIWLEKDSTKALPPIPALPPASVGMTHIFSSSHSVEDDNHVKDDKDAVQSSSVFKPNAFQQLRSPHLVRPSEIMSHAGRAKGEMACISDEAQNQTDVKDSQEATQSCTPSTVKNLSSGTGVQDSVAESSDSLLFARREDAFCASTITSHLRAFKEDDEEGTEFIEKDISVIQNVEDCTTELGSSEVMHLIVVDDAHTENFLEDKLWSASEVDSQDELKNVIAKEREAGVSATAAQHRIASVKGRKSKNKTNLASASLPLNSDPSKPFSAPATLPEGEAESRLNSAFLDLGLITQVATMQESLNQLIAIQKDWQKQIPVMVAVPVAEEAKRLEGAFGQHMEKVVKANMDAMLARVNDENVRREKQDIDRAQQVSTLLNNLLDKDMPIALECGLKELSGVGPKISQTLLLPLQKSLLTGVAEALQSAIEKFLPQLEKTAVAKLEASITRLLKIQFQTSGRQTLQEELRAGLENLVIPAFERSCEAISEQLDTAFQTGMAEHFCNAQQQKASEDTPLAMTLQEVIGGASVLANVLSDDLLNGTAKLLELIETVCANFSGNDVINHNKRSLPEQALTVQHVEQTLDPTVELNKLLKEGKLEEAFHKALSGDLQLVSWLCLQLEPSSLLSRVPLPLSQGVLLSLVRNLSFDLVKDTGNKLQWIKEAALALDPYDPRLVPHLRGYLGQCYQNCYQMISTTKNQSEQSTLKLISHVINSLLSTCN